VSGLLSIPSKLLSMLVAGVVTGREAVSAMKSGEIRLPCIEGANPWVDAARDAMRTAENFIVGSICLTTSNDGGMNAMKKKSDGAPPRGTIKGKNPVESHTISVREKLQHSSRSSLDPFDSWRTTAMASKRSEARSEA